MTEQSNPRPNAGQFQPGHPRVGGRRKRSAAHARALAEELGVDPIHFLLMIVNSSAIEVPETDDNGKPIIGEDGQPKVRYIAIPLDMRVDAAKAVAPYIHPRLQATQVTGQDGPVELPALPTARILADPELGPAARKLALLVALGEHARALPPVPESDKGDTV
jgi:hypothetical protein